MMLTAWRGAMDAAGPLAALPHRELAGLQGSDSYRVDPAALPGALLQSVRIPYALRRVPSASYARLVAHAVPPMPGDIVLAALEKVGKNARLELANGRPCSLHVGDLLAVVFGNRYATMQFEGYARSRGDRCDLLSMGGLCGVVESKHDSVAESTKLRVLGAFATAEGTPLRLKDFSLAQSGVPTRLPNIVVVCGTSMDAGKTYTATSIIQGLRRNNIEVAGIKLTGTAAGRDTWGMLDAGACVALDFVDGGLPSTYRTPLDELLGLEQRLVAHAVSHGAEWIVIEIADGLLQSETAALLTSDEFTRNVTAWVFAAGDAMSAVAGVRLLREWRLDLVGLSGRVTMSPLAVREAEGATGVDCFTAAALQDGALTPRLLAAGRATAVRPHGCDMPAASGGS